MNTFKSTRRTLLKIWDDTLEMFKMKPFKNSRRAPLKSRVGNHLSCICVLLYCLYVRQREKRKVLESTRRIDREVVLKGVNGRLKIWVFGCFAYIICYTLIVFKLNAYYLLSLCVFLCRLWFRAKTSFWS